MPKYKIIANPASGSGAGARSIPLIETMLEKHGINYDLTRTQKPTQAVEITKQAVETGFEVVVAVGGDGTINEVINGLMQAKISGFELPPMGVLCNGRGNDFAPSVNVPADLDAACRALANRFTKCIDIGKVTGGKFPQGRYFGNCVGVGFDAIGTIEVAKLPRLGGFLSYFIAVLKTIFLYYQAPLIKLEYNGEQITQPFLLVSIMNGKRLGGGFIMAPDAKPDDGLFDMCTADEVSRLEMFRLIPHFMRGSQATQKPIKTGKASRVTITAIEGSLPAQTDGEILCIDGKELEIELLPQQIDIIGLPADIDV